MNKIALLILVVFCSVGKYPQVLSAKVAQLKFEMLVKEMHAWQKLEYPEKFPDMKTFKNIHLVRNYTEEAIERRIQFMKKLLGKLEGISCMHGLSAEMQMAMRIVQYSLKSYIENYKWRKHSLYNTLIQSWPKVKIMKQVSELLQPTKGDKQYLKKMVERIRSVGLQVDQRLELMREAVRGGATLSKEGVQAVIKHMEKELQKKSLEKDVYKSFWENAKKANMTKCERAEMLNDVQKQIKELIICRLQKVLNFLKSVYLPAARKYIGVFGMKDGKEFYKAVLKYHLTTDQTPEEVHALGKREVCRIKSIMKEVLQRLNFNGTITQFSYHLRRNRKFRHASPESIVQGYKDIIQKRILPKAKCFFKCVPTADLRVHAENRATGAFYQDGVFVVGVRDFADQLKLNMMALALHEGYPGHHMDLTYSQSRLLQYLPGRFEGSPSDPFEFPAFTARIEGWGLYSEFLGREMGLYADDYELFGRLNYEMLRACRLVVDTGIHYYGWSREKSIQYFLQNTLFRRPSLEDAITRYASSPGQACAYKIGQLKIKALRATAIKKIGRDVSRYFDLKEFHHLILRHRTIPLSELEQVVNRWIREDPPREPCQSNSRGCAG